MPRKTVTTEPAPSELPVEGLPPVLTAYTAVTLLSSNRFNRLVLPGEQIELTAEEAEILLKQGCVTEVLHVSDPECPQLGELQDRTQS